MGYHCHTTVEYHYHKIVEYHYDNTVQYHAAIIHAVTQCIMKVSLIACLRVGGGAAINSECCLCHFNCIYFTYKIVLYTLYRERQKWQVMVGEAGRCILARRQGYCRGMSV